MIVEICTEQALESLHRYSDESWSNYITRLKDKATNNKLSEEEVFKKLRREEAPEILRTFFYAFKISLDTLIERVKEFELNAREIQERKIGNRINMARKSSHTRDKAQIVCFTCNEKGHYSYECPKKVAEGMPTRIGENSPFGDLFFNPPTWRIIF
ncbi:hypothetical protein NGRA_3044 [Nosema granulosis]|uniref:CCHC-type domain-containing protein n=1 Tax=Nosema granulosis TaxID=83296 RepID=A0A9P6GVG3_9MICR|nr:hypothetical protein NGRA_3044 [Nosema granulosis]